MGKKIKILFVITKSNWGGAQKYVYDLATNLPKDRFDVAVAVGGNGILIQRLLEQNIRIISIPSLVRDVNIWKDFVSLFELFSIFQKEKPDVVHLNSAKASGVGAFIARIADVPKIIFTAHGWAFNEERPYWQRSIIKFFSWLTVVFSHKTIAVSEAVNRDTINWPFVQGKVATIHNGIDAPVFLPREQARPHIPTNAFLIGTIAELHPNKGLPYAIEACATISSKNPNFYYVIIGSGEEEDHLNTLLKRNNYQPGVLLLGPKENASRYLKGFDAFLLPSIKEGLPYVLLEAGLAGLPVIATEVGGIPEIIEDGRTGLLIPPRDPDAIAAAINKLISSPSLCTALGHALHEKVIAEFSQKTMVNKTMSLYEA